ncbi:hypothetical protein [Streptosporangium sp. NPDC002721]|uniref:hypothetical protein n=1 Tax=Streptosporangium sp. NPDC002721 TaxID=3366188 RepID=UPI0036C74A2D
MATINAIKPKRMSTLRIFTTTILCATLVISGCGLLHTTLKVDPATVAEVRAIGKVIAHTTTSGTWEDTTQVDDFLLVDLGAVDYEAARNKARNQLQGIGWKTSGSGHLWIHMKSTKWANTVLKIDSFENYEAHGEPLESKVEKALMTEPAKTQTYIILTLTRTA